MANTDFDLPDALACPLLGLAADTSQPLHVPHPSHRCFARTHAATIDARRQSTYCLKARFDACDHFRVFQRRVAAGDKSGPPTGSDAPFAQRGSVPSATPAQITTAVVVFRTGDTLASIAARYGLTVQQIMAANHLASPDGVADGARLLIPLGRSSGGVSGTGPWVGQIGPVDDPDRPSR